MKILIFCLTVFSLSQGFPRPSSIKDDTPNTANRRQGVNYGYPESASETAYTSDQATAFTSPAAYSLPADQQSTASYQDTTADQSSAQKTATPSPYADSQSQTSGRQSETPSTQDQSTQTQTQASQSSTAAQDSAAPATQTSAPAPTYQDSSQANTPAASTAQSTETQAPATPTAPEAPTYQDSSKSATQAPATQTSAPTYQDSSKSATQSPSTQPSAPTYQDSSKSSTPASTTTSETQTQAAATASSQPQTSTSQTQYPAQTQTATAQDSTSTSSQSQAYNQNNGSNEYTNPPQPYSTGQTSPQSETSSQTTSDTSKPSYNPQGYNVPDNTQYKIENVTSKTVPDQANASSPVYLSSTATANVADSSNPDDKKKSPTFNKETVVHGNHATTYLELPKHLHKPAIVKYQVQIAPKVDGKPIEQEIAIMPPEGTGGERKPLVLLKQVVSKPTDEHIQVIVPKAESGGVNTPKVEVKGGHVDQEALNSQDQGQSQSQGQTQDQYQGQSQSQGQTQDQGQSQSQGQTQDQYQAQSESQTTQNPSQAQSQYQDQSQGQNEYQGQASYQDQSQGQDLACGGLAMCKKYNPNMCNQEWVKRHCKKMCGLCTPQEETSFSDSSSKETSSPKHCEYSGVIHQSGETWSPGPCVPKCHCDNGHIKCSKLECPDLNCDKPVKRRWKCCPECLPNSDNETRCGVETTGGNGENLCCVFPFNYNGVDYFTCTAADSQEPWCSITRNYDRDGLWGNCVVKSNTGKKHIKQADSDEKSALVLAAQLSGARKWRNSSNNQVTNALQSVPSPLSKDDLDKLRANDNFSRYTDSNNASGASGDISAQADYYRNAGVDLPQGTASDGQGKGPYPSYNGAYKDNSASSVTSPMTPSPITSPASPASSATSSVTPSTNLSEQPVYNSADNSSSSYAPTGSPYSDQTTAPYDKTSEAVGANSDPRVQDNRGFDTGVADTGGSNNGGSNTGGSSAGDSQYSSYHSEANNPSGVSAYGGGYGQASTARDTSDNTVPNGIENQTSYEMNPDASTAQYGNNQPATT